MSQWNDGRLGRRFRSWPTQAKGEVRGVGAGAAGRELATAVGRWVGQWMGGVCMLVWCVRQTPTTFLLPPHTSCAGAGSTVQLLFEGEEEGLGGEVVRDGKRKRDDDSDGDEESEEVEGEEESEEEKDE